jgi:hypothetical protein
MKKSLLTLGIALALTSSVFCEETKSVDAEETTKKVEEAEEAVKTVEDFAKELEEISK